MNTIPHPVRRHQGGAALLVSLVMLMILTVLGITSIQVTGLEERMANATRDRNMAFQAAEAALREGEAQAELATELEFGSVTGLYAEDTDLDPFASTTWASSASIQFSSDLTGVATRPRFVVEDLGGIEAAGASSRRGEVLGTTYLSSGNLRAYRVFARGTGATDGAEVVLESTYSSFK